MRDDNMKESHLIKGGMHKGQGFVEQKRSGSLGLIFL